MPPESPRARAVAFCKSFGLTVPVLLAPMAGACPVSLSIAVANAGGMGAMGALLHDPGGIAEWVSGFRAQSRGPFQLNTWVPDRPSPRDRAMENRMRDFLSRWGPDVPASAGEIAPHDFEGQCRAFLDLPPPVVSSIMGVYPPDVVRDLKQKGISCFCSATSLSEARQAQAAGADAIVAQGCDAGGHLGSFEPLDAEKQSTGLFALLPRLESRARTHDADACVHRPLARAVATDFTRAAASHDSPHSSALSRAARAYDTNARSRGGGERSSPHDDVGRAICGDGETDPRG